MIIIPYKDYSKEKKTVQNKLSFIDCVLKKRNEFKRKNDNFVADMKQMM